MLAAELQNKGIGSSIITELGDKLKELGVAAIRLGWVNGNPQAEHFWKKNGFNETGITYDTADYMVIVAEKAL